jgi:hypothetical protein
VQNTAVALIQETLAQVNTRMTLSAQYGANVPVSSALIT